MKDRTGKPETLYRDRAGNSRQWQSKVLLRYVLTLVLLMFLPFLILNIMFWYNGLKQVESAYLDAQEYALRQIIHNIDSDLVNFRMVGVQLGNDRDVTPYLLQSNEYEAVLAMKKLLLYHANVSFLEKFYLLIGTDRIYAGDGGRTAEVFEGIYDFSGEEERLAFWDYVSRAEAFALSVDGNGGVLYGHGGQGCYVAITYPYMRSMSHPVGCIIGLIDTDYFEDALEIAGSGYEEGVYLLDREGRIQFAAEDGLSIPEGQLAEIALTGGEENRIIKEKIGGKVCFVLSGKSQVTDWRYAVVIPQGQFYAKYMDSQNLFLLVVVTFMVLCILIGIAVAFRIYRPVNELWSLIRDTENPEGGEAPDSGAWRMDEWERIRRSVADILERDRNFALELDTTKNRQEQNFLNGLLLGIVHVDNFQKRENVLGNYFRKAFFTVLVLYGPLESAERRASMIERIDSLHVPELYLIELGEREGIAMIWNTNDPPGKTERQEIQRIYGQIRKEDGAWILGVGSCQQGIAQINRSYVEALVAGESMRMQERTGVFYYKEYSGQQGNRDIYTVQANLLPHFLVQMSQVCEKIVEERKQEQDEQNSELMKRILDYVDGHYCDSSMGLGEVAEQFDISASWLSGFFRKNTGLGFLEYVTEKRMGQACTLLQETDLPVREIVVRIGYLDVSSFTKKFRLAHGVSPGKYREQWREADKGGKQI